MANTYSSEIKAQVIADYAMGATKAALAKKYGVGRSTIIAWVRNHQPPVPTVSDPSQRDELGRLVYEYLVTGFTALIAQHRLAADEAYLKQSSTPLAAIYEAIHAGVVVIADAIESAADDRRIDASPDSPG